MAEKKDKVAFIVATKDRPVELRRMLESLARQSRLPDQVVLVDGGDPPVLDVAREFPFLRIDCLRCVPPSGTRQRNEGLKRVLPEMTLVGFLDDDVVLERDALQKMMEFWGQAREEIGGAAFNLINHPPLFASRLKSLPLAERIGLYSRQKGAVLPSGFHTMIGCAAATTFVRWLPTTAVTWRKAVFETFRFDEGFRGYSYLEDLDFSYGVGKNFRLAVVEGASYYHYPAPGGRGRGYEFGRREVINRIYFVRKHGELSVFRCCAGLMVRMAISLYLASRGETGYYLQRIRGNLAGLLRALTKPGRKG
jgi:GT2 family glycosyltransferase